MSSSIRSGLRRRDRESSSDKEIPAKRAKTGSQDDDESDVESVIPSDDASPWDPTFRVPVKVEELDLDKSYENRVNYILPAPKALPKRQKRWRHKGKEPLTEYSKLSRGWNANEPDLHELSVFQECRIIVVD